MLRALSFICILVAQSVSQDSVSDSVIKSLDAWTYGRYNVSQQEWRCIAPLLCNGGSVRSTYDVLQVSMEVCGGWFPINQIVESVYCSDHGKARKIVMCLNSYDNETLSIVPTSPKYEVLPTYRLSSWSANELGMGILEARVSADPTLGQCRCHTPPLLDRTRADGSCMVAMSGDERRWSAVLQYTQCGS